MSAYSDNLQSAPSWLVTTKLEPSRANIDLVHRPRLIETLNQSLNRKIALVTAPAGFGKTTLLYQWFDILSARSVLTAWLTLDDNDSDPQQFLSYIALALAEAGIDIADLSVSARNGFSESPVRNIVSSLMECLKQHSGKCVLLLDDYHTVSSNKIDELIKQIIHEMPLNFTIVINSRNLPNFDLPSLTVNGEIVQINADNIRLSKEETISTLGGDIRDEDIEGIYTKTEGWPVAVQLVRFHKNSQLIKGNSFSGASTNLIASYLTDQVISTVDDDVRDLLFHVAVLESFNPSLADAVREKNDSWDILSRINSLSAFFISLDREGDWFRLHHLIAEYLRDTLRRKNPTAIKNVCVRASEWYEEHGTIIEAIKYSLRNEDYDRCQDLFLKAGGWKIIITQGIGVMRSMFRLIPEHVVSSNARLLIARSYLHCKDGEYTEARGLLDASKALRSKKDGDAYDSDYLAIASMIGIYEDDFDDILAIGTNNFVQTASNDCDLELGTRYAGHALANIAYNDFEKTESSLKKSFNHLRRSGSLLGVNYCYIHAACLASYRAAFDLAQANIHQALELSESNFGSDSGLQHLSIVTDLSVKIWLGQFKPHEKDTLFTSIKHVTTFDGWVEVFIFCFDAGYHYANVTGDTHFSDEIIKLFTDVAQRRHLPRLNEFLNAAQLLNIYNKSQLPSSVMADWMRRVNYEKIPMHWQAHYQALGCAASSFSTGDKNFLTLLDEAIEHSLKQGADFHNIRLNLYKVIYLHRSNYKDESYERLIETLKKAVSKRLILPFLINERLVRILRETRNELRARSEELILVAFISEIFSYYDTVRTTQDNGLLSNREQDIIQQLALGKSNKEIARVFELTENTVKFHLKSIYKKLSVNSRTQSIVVAKNLGIIE